MRNTHVGERNAVVGNAQRAVAAAIASLLAYYYDGDEQVLDAVTASTPGLARNLEAKLASRAVSGEGARFVVAALGSSVTAGHDNVGSTAWPAVLERRLRGALGPLGIDVEVFLRNALGLPGAPSVFFLNLDADGAGQKTKALGKMFALSLIHI